MSATSRTVGPGIEMPRYKCHKEVHALKIAEIRNDSDLAHDRETDGSAMLIPEDKRYAALRVESAWLRKHSPVAGGYYVVYPGDGYASFSPAKAFEDGYTAL